MMQWRRVFAHRSAGVGLVLVALALLTALLAPMFAPHDPTAQERNASGVAPGVQGFVLGTDINGRDILSRVIYGARISLLVGVVATLLNLLIGMLVGTLAAYYGGWVDSLLMRITDIFFAFPSILLAIIILATLNQPAVREALAGITGNFDPGIWGLFIALGLTGWTGVARIIRGQVLALKEREFIEAARAIGCGHVRIMFVHLVPNCLAPVIVVGTLQRSEERRVG